ncbi:MAG: hypothetical protein PHZ26_03175 [Candidatus Gracilibacteria bacterium]|nr:hypothetical protein [Candidatus Gracilibacteria bacterium]MDD2908729.1 hypothetical protein [Candidatus Gracilibacteria bacterium]
MTKSIRKFFGSLLVFVASIFILFQELVWTSVKPVLEYFSKINYIQKSEVWVKSLSINASLTLFMVIFVSSSLLEIWAIGLTVIGKIYIGFSIYAISKILSFIVLSRIFTLTKPKLMEVSWFKNLFDWLVYKKNKLYSQFAQFNFVIKIELAIIRIESECFRLKDNLSLYLLARKKVKNEE